MIRSIEHALLVEMLLNTLEAERHLRRPLLLEIIGELSDSRRLVPARRAAALLLERLDRGHLTEAELTRAVAEVRAKISCCRFAAEPTAARLDVREPRAASRTPGA